MAYTGSRCDQHPAEQWVKRGTGTKRITGRRLQAMREALFRVDPLCAECKRNGRTTAATQRDHIVPLFEGGRDDEGNTQGLCHDCHEAKSLAEALRARRPPREGGG